MRLLLSALTAVLLMAQAMHAQIPPTVSLPQPIYTRQNSFGVPFVMDPAEPGARRAVEVQLHVSENGGPWKLTAKVPPMNSSIFYRATRDGEYRFMVRTKDDQGELLPLGPPHPELIVVLDTDPPVLELLADRDPGGEVHARWRVRDAHLRAPSLRLEYQVGLDGPWLPVAIDLPAVGSTTSAREATWVPESRSVPITIRAEVADLAGNVAKREIRLAAVRPKSDPSAPPAEVPHNTATHWPAERTQDVPLNAADPPKMGTAFPWQPGGMNNVVKGPLRTPVVAEEVAPQEFATNTETLPPPNPDHAAPEYQLPENITPDSSTLALPNAEQVLPVPTRPEEVELPTAADARHTAPRTRRDLESGEGPRLPWPETLPTVTDSHTQPRVAPAGISGGQPPGAELLPPGLQPRMINHRQVELDYDAEFAGPAGLRKVEAFGTADGGRTWTSYGVDNDLRSPMVVAVDRDGIFGFRIAMESASGLQDTPPQAGDAPDAWIGVDTTPPAARLIGSRADAGTLTIQWEAADAALGPRPIAIFHSPQPGGPWTTIATDQPNSGQYVWRWEKMPGERVYLRLQVRDLAGNVQVVDSTEPVALTATRPRGHIREVRPAAHSPAQNSSTP